MRTPTRKRKPRTAKVTSLPAPTGGLVSNRNLSLSRGPDMPPAAAVLENWFPTATSVVARRGSVRWASIIHDSPVKSLFSYISGGNRSLFAATDEGVWDITAVSSPYAFALVNEDEDYIAADIGNEQAFGDDPLADFRVLAGVTSGDWVTVQFSTPGGDFIIGVNGDDTAFVYDGATFEDASITFPDGSGLTTADLSYVWSYKERLWFIQKNSLNAWYLPVDQIGGELTLWPMGGVFVRGGTLLWGETWSLDSGSSGGLSEQCVFTTTEGQVAAYQGLSPEPDQGWTKVGVYRTGIPMGKRAHFSAGGDIVMATTVGLISLAAASKQDYAALGQGAVSYPIEDDWTRAIQERGQLDWRCEVWADGKMVIIAPPQAQGTRPVLFVANANTGKWCTFTGWDVTSMAVFRNGLFFGSSDGAVRQGWIGGSDEGRPYVSRALPLFDNLNAPASLKVIKAARAIVRTSFEADVQLSGHFDYRIDFPASPGQAGVINGNEWDTGIWGESIWDAERNSLVLSDWVSLGGSGHDVSVGVQITSGGAVPTDAELVRIDLTYSVAEVVT